MKIYRNSLLAGAAVIALGFGQPAWATGITIDPGASTGVTGVGGPFVLDPGQSPFAVTGGSGLAFQDMLITSTTQLANPDAAEGTGNGQTFATDIVVNITGFVGSPGALTGGGVFSTWSLFAVISLTGTGNWTGVDNGGSGPDIFTATTTNMNLQIYGKNSPIRSVANPDSETNPETIHSPGDVIVPTGTSSLSQIVMGSDLGQLGAGGKAMEGASFGDCYDGSANDANLNSLGGSNCVLLASSSSSTGDALQVVGTTSSPPATPSTDSETFSIAGALLPQSYDIGDPLFFDVPTSISMNLSVDSGAGTGSDLSASPIVVDNDENIPEIGYTTGTCDGGEGGLKPGQRTDCGQNVNWDITSSTVPEPASMTLLGTGLIALGAAVRRRQRKTRRS